MWKSFKAQLQNWNAYVAVLTTIIPDKLQTVAWIIKWRNAFLNIVILCQENIVWYLNPGSLEQPEKFHVFSSSSLSDFLVTDFHTHHFFTYNYFFTNK